MDTEIVKFAMKLDEKVKNNMTQNELIELAKQAGWKYAHGESGFEPLWAFAKLVIEKEREQCAKLCESHISYPSRLHFAAAIRAMGDT